jgi:hypothetical protein
MSLKGKTLIPGVFAFTIALIILLRQDYLFDTDPYLHLSVAKYVYAQGFPDKIPFVEIMGNSNFNYLSEKWLFIYILSFFYKMPLNDILLSKLFIALVFGGIVFILSLILGDLNTDMRYSLFLFAFPFQILLKLRPEPLGLLLTLTLVYVLLKELGSSKKILLISIILLVHSQVHAFFVFDIGVLILYALLYKETKIVFALLSIPIGLLFNPYRGLWVSSLYLDSVKRIGFPGSSLTPSELLRPNFLEIGFFILIFVISYHYLRRSSKREEKLLFAITGVSLALSTILLRVISHASVFLTILVARFISEFPTKKIKLLVLPLMILNIAVTILFPSVMMPGYDEDLQIEVISQLSPSDKILAQWDLSPYVIYFSGAKTYTAGDIYYLWLSSEEALRDYEDLFLAREIKIDKFNATAIYFDKKRFSKLYDKLVEDENSKILAENERFVAIRV